MYKHRPLDLSQGGAVCGDEITYLLRWPLQVGAELGGIVKQGAHHPDKGVGPRSPAELFTLEHVTEAVARRLVGPGHGSSQLATKSGPLRVAERSRELPARPARELGHDQVVVAGDDPRAGGQHLGHWDT